VALSLPLKKGMWLKGLYGDIVQIDSICDCERCQERGFLEPSLSDGNYISNYEFQTGFQSWIMNSFNREDLLVGENFIFCQTCHSNISRQYFNKDFCPVCGRKFDE